ncbi:hypothetical protein RZ532_00950 [Nitratireductor aquimarinus]|uniref:hypothetical protein n=1 Tax=Nitratireductor aquimarinus TaxID=889300 RepID=UPI0029363819|nr:hypothetical protein [Nitratireductor aquimarinus]MDV2964528.1 hypothetical protein [Nitratireductor aquimarinus]
MELANVLVALGGERGHTVPKRNVTPAEVAILMAIHGEDAVHEIEVQEDTSDRSGRAEVEHLYERYKATDPDTGKFIVGEVFPGRNPDLPKTFEALGLPDELYKATSRATPAKGKAKKSASQKKPAAPKEPETPANEGSGDGENGGADTSILD